MGSTGHSIYNKSRSAELDNETFGINNAVVFKGKIPTKSGLEAVSGNKITLKVPADKGTSILFQFKLTRDGKLMSILAYKNGVPEVRCKVAVDSGAPSLDKLIASGSKAEKLQAVKMKDLFAKSAQVNEGQLSSIANKLLAKKREREG